MLAPWSFCLLIVSVCQLAHIVHADTTNFVTNATIVSPNLTSSCAAALTANVSCNQYVRRFQRGIYFQEPGLEASCTSACSSALSNWQASVASACSNQTFSTDTNNKTLIITIPETVTSNYQLACAQADGNKFCNIVALNASIAASNGSKAVTSCDDCAIKLLQIQVDSPVYGGWQAQKMFSSLTSSCRKTSFSLTTSWPSTASATTTTAASPTCTGKTYKIKSGDTCQSISLSQGIGTNWLLTDNSLPAYCSKFPQNGNLCLVNTCKVYTVRANDTCQSVAASWNITEPQLLTWNPVLGTSCASMTRSVGSQICIGSPGTQYNGTITTSAPGVLPQPTAAPVPKNIANGTNTKCAEYYSVQPGDYCNLLTIKFSISLDDFRFLNPSINANCTNLLAFESYCVEPVGDIDNYPGHSGYVPPPTAYSTIPWTSFPKATYVPKINVTTLKPFAAGTRLDCVLYTDGAEQYVTPNATNACQDIADGWDISLDTLTNWNPSLNGSNPACHFDANLRYCVQAFQSSQAATTAPANPIGAYPIRDGSWTNCSTYALLTYGETCQELLDSYEINIGQFYNWNPAVGAQCQNLWTSYRYCVRLGAWVPPSTSATPTATPTSSKTSTSSPSSKTSQSSTPSRTSIPTTHSTSTTTSSYPSPPAQTQPGEPSNCKKWVVVKSGDTCYSIEQAAGITASQFLQLNPPVKSDCSNLWLGYAYCISA